jgi:flagellar biosynthesis anti-sigma factor FlgM
MKVNNNKDSVELSHMSRAKRAEKTAAANKANEGGVASEAGATGLAAGVELSDEAKAMNAMSQIAKADNTDQAKIDRIKAMISSGSYKPDFNQVADKMINETLLQDIS